jgi:hypothetical protein
MAAATPGRTLTRTRAARLLCTLELLVASSAAVRKCTGAPSCVRYGDGSEAEWAAYLHAVYGEPVHPSYRRRLTWHYRCNNTMPCESTPPPAPVRVSPRHVHLWDVTMLGEAYRGKMWSTDGMAFMDNWGYFIRREEFHTPAPDGAWIEVMRARKHDEGDFNSTWFYATRGSGIWLNVGKTIEMAIGADMDCHRSQVAYARSRGYDTIQYTSAWTCSLHEIVDVRAGARQELHGLTTCGATELRTGLHAQLPCPCDDSAPYLNCGRAHGRPIDPIRPAARARRLRARL